MDISTTTIYKFPGYTGGTAGTPRTRWPEAAPPGIETYSTFGIIGRPIGCIRIFTNTGEIAPSVFLRATNKGMKEKKV